MPRVTRQTAARLRAAEAQDGSPSKRTKTVATKPSQKPKKKAQGKQKSLKETKKQEKEDKPDGLSVKAMSSQERFLEKVDPFFVQHIEELTCGRKNLRVFVPLCGNSADMLWLANQGHSVTGVELMAKWIKSFFKKSELKYTVTSEELVSKKKVNVYRAEDKDIVIYQCGIFDYDLSVAQVKFDGIWDQSAVPVINEMGEEQLQQYVDLLQTLLVPDGRHVVEVCKHGANFVTTEKLQELYGGKSDVRYLGTRVWKYEEEEEEQEEEGSCEGVGDADEQHRTGDKQDHATQEQSDHSYSSHHCGDHGNGDHHHGDHGDQSQDIEMFYHVICFKEKQA